MVTSYVLCGLLCVLYLILIVRVALKFRKVHFVSWIALLLVS